MGFLNRMKGAVGRGAQALGLREIDENSLINYSPSRPSKLCDAIKQSYKDMEPFRKTHNMLLKEFVGDRYGDTDIKRKRIWINLIHQYVQTHMHMLSGQTPKIMVVPEYKALTSHAYKQEVALNRIMKEVNFSQNTRRAVMNHMFSFGVTKIAMGEADEQIEIDGHLYDPGQPFVRTVNPDNFIVDMQAESLEEVDFMGDRFRRPYSWINEKRKEKTGRFSSEGDTRIDMKPEDRLTGVRETPEYRADKSAWVWQIWLPRHGETLYFVNGEEKPFFVEEWDGPERVPYEVLCAIDVPGEPIGMSPAMVLYNLHEGANNLVRKLFDQAERQKFIAVFDKGNEDDAKNLKDAKDGELIGLNNPEVARELRYGGPDMNNHNFAMWSRDMFNMFGGNLELLSGSAPQSETAAQDKLLASAANVPVESMGARVTEFYDAIVMRIAWYHWYTQPLDMDISIPVTDEVSLPYTITPEDREGDYLEYNFSIVPYSMRKETPKEQLAKYMQLWNEFVMPSAEIAASAGLAPNFQEFGRLVCKLAGVEFENLFMQQDGQQMEQQKPGMVPESPRFKRSHTINERISRSGTTQRGMNAEYLKANAAQMTGQQTQGQAS